MKEFIVLSITYIHYWTPDEPKQLMTPLIFGNKLKLRPCFRYKKEQMKY